MNMLYIIAQMQENKNCNDIMFFLYEFNCSLTLMLPVIRNYAISTALKETKSFNEYREELQKLLK